MIILIFENIAIFATLMEVKGLSPVTMINCRLDWCNFLRLSIIPLFNLFSNIKKPPNLKSFSNSFLDSDISSGLIYLYANPNTLKP